MTGPEMRGPAPRAHAENRAEVIRNGVFSIIAGAEPEADFVAVYVSRRYRLAMPLARAVAALASLGRAFA